MFKNLCCSKCKSDFDEDSMKLLRKEDSMFVVRLVCQHCGKSFGVAFLGVSDIDVKDKNDEDITLNVQEGLPPITKDDVLDAHKFIKNLDEHWSQYLP